MLYRSRKILAIVFIGFCWLPQIRYLFPMPQIDQAKQLSSTASDYSEGQKWIVENDLQEKNNLSVKHLWETMWKSWFFYLFAIAFGVISGLIAYLNRFKWKLFVILSSSLYLYSWYVSGSTSSTSLMKSYELKLKTARLIGSYGTFIYKDILLPIVFVSLIMLILYKQIARTQK